MAAALRLSTVVVLVVLFIETPGEAYLDPGAGSMLLQLLLGGVAAAGVVVKLFWHRLRIPFRKRDSGSEGA